MEKEMLNLFNQVGIEKYTFSVIILTCIGFMIYNLVLNLSEYIYQRSLYWFDKRKELKKNGS